MNQPTKDALREQLALAADEKIRLLAALVWWEEWAHRRSWRGRVRAWWRRVRESLRA